MTLLIITLHDNRNFNFRTEYFRNLTVPCPEFWKKIHTKFFPHTRTKFRNLFFIKYFPQTSSHISILKRLSDNVANSFSKYFLLTDLSFYHIHCDNLIFIGFPDYNFVRTSSLFRACI